MYLNLKSLHDDLVYAHSSFPDELLAHQLLHLGKMVKNVAETILNC